MSAAAALAAMLALEMPASLLPMRLPVDEAPGWTVTGQASRFEASDATPVADISGDWDRYTPRGGRNAALQSIRVELAAQTRGWELAAVVHSDIVIRGSRDTFDLLHDYKQRQTPAPGSSFALDADSQGAVWAGLRGARSWTQGPLSLTAGLTLLSARRVQRAQLDGTAGYSTQGVYSVQAAGMRQDSFREFEGYGERHASGRGYTGELGLLWRPWDGAFVNVSAVDLFSRLTVNRVATQQIQADSATASVDADGYVNYAPLLSGRYSSATVRMRLPRKSSIAFGSEVPGGGGLMLGGRWEQVAGIGMPALWASLPAGAGARLQADVDLRFRSIGLGIGLPHGTLMIRTQSLPWGQSNATGWVAAFAWPFQ